MAVVTREGTTTITPTALRWYAGAGAIVILSALAGALTGFHMIAAGVVAAIGSGHFVRLVLDPDGFTSTVGFKTQRFVWNRVGGFKVNTMRYSIFTVLHQIAFTDVDAAGSIGGKVAQFLSGGTHTLPVYGIRADDLVRLMEGYQTGRVPADTPAEAPRPAQPAATPRPVGRVAQTRETPKPKAMTMPARVAPTTRIPAGVDPLVEDSASRRRAVRGGSIG